MDSRLLRGFREPQDDFRPVSMWFINDRMTREEITAQLEGFRAKGIFELFFNASYGMEDDYLSEHYFEMFRWTVREARRVGVYIWIYDEYEFPSGIAGGKLLRDHPEFRARVLEDTQIVLGAGRAVRRRYAEGRFVAAFRAFPDEPGQEAEDVSDLVQIEPAADGFYFSFTNRLCGTAVLYVLSDRLQTNILSAALGARFSFSQDGYIDALRDEAIRAFIDCTHEKYKEAVGDEFGKTVKGVFTDEVCVGDPHELGNGKVPWNDELETRFEQRWGYSLRPWLYALIAEPRTPQEKKVRYHFWRLLTERVRDAHIRQVYEWCDKEGLLYTGHFDGEESLIWSMYQSGDIFDLLEWMHIPGIDSIYSRLKIEEIYFNSAARIVSSAARFYRRDRILCETYTGSGYRLRFHEMRRIANRLLLMGVNMIHLMGAHYSMDNARKSWKPSFNYNNPLFAHFDTFGAYLARIQYVSAQTKPAGRVLVMCPQAGVYSDFDGHGPIFGTSREPTAFGRYESALWAFTNCLMEQNVEFDLFSDAMADRVTAADGEAALYGAKYDVVFLPDTGHTTSAVVAMVRRLQAAGMKVVFTDELPELTVDDAQIVRPFGTAPKTDDVRCIGENLWFFRAPGFGERTGREERFGRCLAEVLGDACRTLDIRHNGNILTALREAPDGTQVVFLANDCGEPRHAGFRYTEGMQLLDPATGGSHAFFHAGGRAEVDFEPHQFFILVCGGEALPCTDLPGTKVFRTLDPVCRITPEDGNILPASWQFAPCGGFDGGEIVLPPEDQLTALDPEGKLPASASAPGSCGVLVFDFDVAFVPDSVRLFAEYACIRRCELNGVRIDDKWSHCRLWGPRDASLEVSPLLRQGKNRLTAVFQVPDYCSNFFVPFVLLRGDFETDGQRILPRHPHHYAAPCNRQGFPRLSGRGTYRFTVTLDAAAAAETVSVSLDALDAAELFVNGVSAGVCLWKPFRYDTRGLFHEGENTLEVRMTLPIQNLLCQEADRIDVGLLSAPRLEKPV